MNDKDSVNGDMEEENATLRETTEDTTRIRQEQRKLKERGLRTECKGVFFERG